MTDPTPRHESILATLLEQDWLRGQPALAKCAAPAAVLALSLADDLGLDSLDVVKAGLDLEDAFEIEPTDAEINALRTVRDVVELVERKAQR